MVVMDEFQKMAPRFNLTNSQRQGSSKEARAWRPLQLNKSLIMRARILYEDDIVPSFTLTVRSLNIL